MKWTIMITLVCWLPIGPIYGRGNLGGSHYGAGTNSYGPGTTVTYVNTPINGFTTTYTVKTNPGPVVHGSNPHNTAPVHNHKAESKIYNLKVGPGGYVIQVPK